MDAPLGMYMSASAASQTEESSGCYFDEDDEVLADLWHACAGFGKSLPPVDSVVAYLPQGHIEQINPTHLAEVEGQIPRYQIPPVIRCLLQGVKLSADPLTDEVFADLTLRPLPSNEPFEEESSLSFKEPKAQAEKKSSFFTKLLTNSDTSSHGGLAVPKRGAEDHFPPLDKSIDGPSQMLVFKDLHGKEWTFKHVFRGEPKRHLLTTGWSTFVSNKRVETGDVIVFLRGEDGQLRIGLRRAARNQQAQSKVLTSPTMTIGVLAAAAHAVEVGRRFSLIYNPRSCPSEFVIQYSKFIHGMKNEFAAGQRFKMRLETEEKSDRRYTGTITGISEYDPVRWPKSLWRSLEVNWSESSPNDRVRRVSPWEIEPFTVCPLPTKVRARKRSRPPIQLPVANNKSDRGPNLAPVPPPQILSRPQVPTLTSRLPSHEGHDQNWVMSTPVKDATYVPSSKLSWASPHDDCLKSEALLGNRPRGDWLQSRRPDRPPLSEVFRSHAESMLPDLLGIMNTERTQHDKAKLFADRAHSLSQKSDLSSPFPVKAQCVSDADLRLSLSSTAGGQQQVIGELGYPDVNFWERRVQLDSGYDAARAPLLVPETIDHRCKLFGVAIDKAPTSKVSEDPLEVKDTGVILGTSSKPDLTGVKADGEGCDLAKADVTLLGTQNRQAGAMRSFIKVYMQGAIGRSIDVSKFQGYKELIEEVEGMFGLEGELFEKKHWQLIYTDHEEDVLMVGDDPWDEFCSCVRSIRVVSSSSPIGKSSEMGQSSIDGVE